MPELSASGISEVVSLTNKALRSFGIYDVKSAVGLLSLLVIIIVYLAFATEFIEAVYKLGDANSYGHKQALQASANWLNFNRDPMRPIVKMWSLEPMVMVLDALSEAVQKYEYTPENESEEDVDEGYGEPEPSYGEPEPSYGEPKPSYYYPVISDGPSPDYSSPPTTDETPADNSTDDFPF